MTRISLPRALRSFAVALVLLAAVGILGLYAAPDLAPPYRGVLAFTVILALCWAVAAAVAGGTDDA